MERSLARRLETAFAVLHPHRANTRGYAEWFRRALMERREVYVTPVTIHRWLTDGVPVDRLVVVDDVVKELEHEARELLERNMRTIGP